MMTNTTTLTLEQALNQQVANFSILYVKIHNYHWYVKGEQFFTLHAKFEELYNDVTQKRTKSPNAFWRSRADRLLH